MTEVEWAEIIRWGASLLLAVVIIVVLHKE